MILKRTLVFLLTAVLCVGMLTGCAKPGTGTSASAASVSESDTEVSDNKPVTVKNPNYKNVTISEWGYENLEYINEHYLFAKEGDKWIIVSSKSGNKVEWPFKFKEDSYQAEFDFVYMNLQGGCFIGVIAEEDGTYTSALFDPNAEIIRFKLHKSQGNLVDYRDNLIIAETRGKDNSDYYYIISINDGDYGYTAYRKDKLSFLRSSYGILNLSFNTFYTDIRTCGWRFNSYDVRDYIDDKSEDKGKLLEYAESVNNSYGDKAVQVWPNTTNKEGWVRASVFDIDDTIEGSPQFQEDTGRSGFYNLLTHEFLETSKDTAGCAYFVTENGTSSCTVSDSRAAISVSLGTDENGEEITAYRIYDLRTGTWANDDYYASVKAFGYHKYVRVQGLDGRWGFVDDETMEQTGEWYDVATDFCNGYALVVKDLKAYLIDENLKQVSEEIEGDGVGFAIDYLEFSDLNGKPVFFVRLSDGLYHMITIE